MKFRQVYNKKMNKYNNGKIKLIKSKKYKKEIK